MKGILLISTNQRSQMCIIKYSKYYKICRCSIELCRLYINIILHADDIQYIQYMHNILSYIYVCVFMGV